MAGPPETIGARVAARDAERFVGREVELARLESLLTDAPERNVVLVHGPGGIGKSALQRELARRAEGRGWRTVVADAASLPHQADALEAIVAPVRHEQRVLVLLDTWEAAEPLTAHLRDGLLRTLPPSWVIVISGRTAPDPGWAQGGWEHVVLDLPLAALPSADAERCAVAHGVAPGRAERIAAWSGGLPLAIVLGALADDGWEPGDPLGSGLAETALQRLWGDWTERLPVLGTAAIARRVTPELLATCLHDGVSASEAMEWLAGLAFTTPLEGGVTLHPAIAEAVRTHLVDRRPDLAAELRARIAVHAHAEALERGASVSLDLALLLQDPELRWGFGWDRTGFHRVSACAPGDADAVEARLDDAARATWWPATRRCFEAASDHVWIVRRGDGTIDGFMVIATSVDEEPPLPDDPVLGPWTAHARSQRHLGESVIWRNATDLTGGRAQQVIGGGGLLVSGAPNPRFLYLPIDPAHPDAVAFSAALGGRHEPALDVDHGEGPTHCHIVDLGPGGMLGRQLEAVLREVGAASAPPPPHIEPSAVRQALRDWDRPDRLARSPLARGTDAHERVDAVRSTIARGIEGAFGTSPAEQQLRAVLAAGIIERTVAHEQVAADLHLSRSTYFRLLRTATERLEAFLSA